MEPLKKKRKKRTDRPITRFRHNFTLPEVTIAILKEMILEEDVSNMSEGIEFCVKYYYSARKKNSKKTK